MTTFEGEIWRYIPNHPKYLVSNLGRVKSFKRYNEGKILRAGVNSKGYLTVALFINGVALSKNVHQLVAMAFLGHIPNGLELVVNHKDFNRLNNRLENLEVITHRDNANFKHIEHSSKYTGVSWGYKKWRADIYLNGKCNYIGSFESEHEAHLAYQNALNNGF